LLEPFWLAFALFNLILSTINLLQPDFDGKVFVSPLTFTWPPPQSTLQILKQAQIPLAAYDTYVLIFGLTFLVMSTTPLPAKVWAASGPVSLLRFPFHRFFRTGR
jgi:hypothetical protein